MPRLREYLTIGICSSYGDGDFRVSCTVADLSYEEMSKLRQACCAAIGTMEQMWREEQMKKPENQQAVEARPVTTGDAVPPK